MPEAPFNPLDKWNLARSVAEALVEQEACNLAGIGAFDGAGLYAIYYTGQFPAYSLLASKNQNAMYGCPIYVGKAVPPGARRGSFELEAPAGPVLFNRLREHARSIQEAENLDIADFVCRYLVCDDIWIPLGEALLIRTFKPLWNLLVDGFGNHDPGSGRYQQQRSTWDVIHPGRSWANRCQPGPKSAVAIAGEAERFLLVLDEHYEVDDRR